MLWMIEFLEINYFIFVQKKNLVFIPEKKKVANDQS